MGVNLQNPDRSGLIVYGRHTPRIEQQDTPVHFHVGSVRVTKYNDLHVRELAHHTLVQSRPARLPS